jgi:hypothetical protein
MTQLEMFAPKEMAPDHQLVGSVCIIPPSKEDVPPILPEDLQTAAKQVSERLENWSLRSRRHSRPRFSGTPRHVADSPLGNESDAAGDATKSVGGIQGRLLEQPPAAARSTAAVQDRRRQDAVVRAPDRGMASVTRRGPRQTQLGGRL